MFIGLLTACIPPVIDDPELDDEVIPPNNGSLEFRFILPVYKKVPKTGIHRITLSFAYSADSLYKGQFFKKVNVSDYQEVYTVNFPVDEYYYDAVVTCSCGGDTCLNGDFPGGRYGMKHDFDKFTIEMQKTLVLETHFE
jgi:hypothetical protein